MTAYINNLPKLHNRYFIIRHGESEANIANIILSHPKHGTKGYGLTKKGESQVENAIKKNKTLDSETEIYSSDFMRAKETAKIVQEYIHAKKITLSKSLRERSFGNWEKTSNKNYEKVWTEDSKNPHHKIERVESASEVLNRVVKLILKLEKKFKNPPERMGNSSIRAGRKILLVAHGDTLQILQTVFLKKSPSMHRKIKHLELAEIRELKLKI